ncbi:hypothetical protein HF521_020218 [Silurus meridionalis]|uniref:C-type lectin domain-containing protein n=1 Tax=Silurus meridionalis TaxID=175797 RepID=A0A8T0BCR2_SILME|nr:hypothetical protein HF521_020218 [Silurus meridionalis]
MTRERARGETFRSVSTQPKARALPSTGASAGRSSSFEGQDGKRSREPPGEPERSSALYLPFKTRVPSLRPYWSLARVPSTPHCLIHFVLSDPRKYYLIQQPKTWNDSQVYCRANHEDLAVIESVENVIRFQSDMKKQNFTSSAWIGLYSDVNNWRWSLGNEPVGSSKLWAAVWGQPNNAERNEFCVIIDNYGWLDATCALLLRFVCFDGLIHLVLSVPRKYYLIQQPKTWNDSQVYCRANHEDLAVIESDENVIRFQSDMQKQNFTSSAWIGLYSDNNWRWSLGNETVGSLKLWAAVWGQPNNGNGNEFCVGIDNYGWLDATCALLLRFVCFDGVPPQSNSPPATVPGAGRRPRWPRGRRGTGEGLEARSESPPGLASPPHRDRLTHVQLLFTWNPSPLRPSKLSFEYLLLPPRSAPAAAPPGPAPEASAPPQRPSYSSRLRFEGGGVSAGDGRVWARRSSAIHFQG